MSYLGETMEKFPKLPGEVRTAALTFEIQTSEVDSLSRPLETDYTVIFVREGEAVGEVAFDSRSIRDRCVARLSAALSSDWFELLFLMEVSREEDE